MQGVGVGAEGGWLALAGGRRAAMGDSWWLAKAISLAKLMMSLRAAGQPPHTPLTYRILRVKNVNPMIICRKKNLHAMTLLSRY